MKGEWMRLRATVDLRDSHRLLLRCGLERFLMDTKLHCETSAFCHNGPSLREAAGGNEDGNGYSIPATSCADLIISFETKDGRIRFFAKDRQSLSEAKEIFLRYSPPGAPIAHCGRSYARQQARCGIASYAFNDCIDRSKHPSF